MRNVLAPGGSLTCAGRSTFCLASTGAGRCIRLQILAYVPTACCQLMALT